MPRRTATTTANNTGGSGRAGALITANDLPLLLLTFHAEQHRRQWVERVGLSQVTAVCEGFASRSRVCAPVHDASPRPAVRGACPVEHGATATTVIATCPCLIRLIRGDSQRNLLQGRGARGFESWRSRGSCRQRQAGLDLDLGVLRVLRFERRGAWLVGPGAGTTPRFGVQQTRPSVLSSLFVVSQPKPTAPQYRAVHPAHTFLVLRRQFAEECGRFGEGMHVHSRHQS